MDYLPEMPAYLAVNAEQARSSEGGKRLLQAAHKAQPEAAELFEQKLKHLYMGLDNPTPGAGRTRGASAQGCGVALGEPGFADYAQGKFRQYGAKEQKLSGRNVLTSGSVSITPLGDSAVLVFSKPEDLDKMVRTAQKPICTTVLNLPDRGVTLQDSRDCFFVGFHAGAWRHRRAIGPVLRVQP